MSENERASIQSEDLSKIRYKSGDKKTSGVDKENKLNDVYGNKFRIPLDHEIIKDHAVSLTRFLSYRPFFELRLVPVSGVVKGSHPANLFNELNSIQLKYEVIHRQELADNILSNPKNGNRFMYEHITHLKTNSKDKGCDIIIDETVNATRKSLRGLLFFYEPYTAAVRDSEKTIPTSLR